ncbi:putative AbiEii toxin of type IV toxin-antitoxin system [Amycolatopsis sulphurea]|uniref:Putative AbiEii toxin of type IV toxin-antitoxin system n=1 Tax=Amycolatopsis sulphurea TaxID=76022 RepID=A0A2A9FBR7_9PSEU|nr:putative AbiEii toxin of type IV toxin-antitoxin system [Amycolatopsis sulphurea]
MTRQPLRKVRIEVFTSIRSATVGLGRLNILVGANGAGKTNFVQAFELLGRIVSGELGLFTGLNGGASVLLNNGVTRIRRATGGPAPASRGARPGTGRHAIGHPDEPVRGRRADRGRARPSSPGRTSTRSARGWRSTRSGSCGRRICSAAARFVRTPAAHDIPAVAPARGRSDRGNRGQHRPRAAPEPRLDRHALDRDDPASRVWHEAPWRSQQLGQARDRPQALLRNTTSTSSALCSATTPFLRTPPEWTRPTRSVRLQVQHVEAALSAAIGDARFVPHLVLHELETWVFAAAEHSVN